MKLIKLIIFLNIMFFTYISYATSMGNLEWNINRNGSDYRSEILPVLSATLCQNTCAADPQCRAWTLVQPTKTCWLKDSAPPVTYGARGMVSGVKVVSD